MKFLLVIDSLGSGGAQNQLTLLAAAFKNVGHEVTFFTYYKHDFFNHRLEENEIKHHRVLKKNKLGVAVVQSLIKAYNLEKYDAVLSFLDTPNFYVCLAAKLARHRPRIVVSYRTKSDFQKMSRWERLRKRWVNQQANAIVSNSHHERKRWVDSYPELDKKWSTIYNFVDMVSHQPCSVSLESPMRLISVGKLRPLKNAKLIVAGLLKLKQRSFQLPVIDWYGDHTPENEGMRIKALEVKQQIKDNGLEDNFRFFQASTRINEIIPTYHGLIHPSLLEGLPNVICEALSGGIPVLASNILDHPMLVSENERGFLFNPNNADELAQAIVDLSDLTSLDYQKFKGNCRRYAEATFSYTKIRDQYLNKLVSEI